MELIISWMMLFLGIFFTGIALWWYMLAYEEYKQKNKKKTTSDYINKSLFGLYHCLFDRRFFTFDLP